MLLDPKDPKHKSLWIFHLSPPCMQEICDLVGGNERFTMLLVATLTDAHSEGVLSQRTALLYLMKKSKKEKIRASEQRAGHRDPGDEAIEILATLILSHVPCEGFNFGPKIAFFAFMLRRMMLALTDPAYLEDRDYYGNKRLDLAGSSFLGACM
jgi:DNA-directed RNA polymerase III subunit RPC2